jgi:hypothetical protein
MLVENLQTFLSTSAAVTALLGTTSSRSDSTNGIFTVEAVDGPALTMPYIAFSQSDGEPIAENMTGTPLLRQAHWMLSCYGSTYKSAKKLAMAVKTVMLAASPTTLPSTQGVWLRRESDESISVGKGTMYGVHVSFLIIFNETA